MMELDPLGPMHIYAAITGVLAGIVFLCVVLRR